MATSHFFIGGGAEHTAEMVRRDSYAKLKGAEGICELADLRVLQTPTAGGNVRVTIGSGYMTSRYAGAIRESYMGSVVTEEVVPIPQNDTGSVRRDLIVMRVEDPFVQGSPWPDPGAGIEDPAEAEEARAGAAYVHIRRIPSVPAGTTRLQDVPGYENDTAITLARVDLPGQTSQVIQAMIVDLRSLHTPRELTEVRAYQASSPDFDMPVEYIESSTGETWPHFAENAGILSVDLPDWGVLAKVVYTISGYSFAAGSPARGRFWFRIAPLANPDGVESQHTMWAADRPGPIRVSQTVRIPKELRGTRQKFYPRARRDAGTPAQGPGADWATNVDFQVTFEEIPD
ncbi:hypothetical protein [Leucobacter sp.]